MQTRKALAVAIAGLLLACGACRRETRDEKIRRDFMEFTQKECPKFVDPYTCLDSAGYDIGNKTLSYHYTVKDTLDNESLYTDDLISIFHDNVQKEQKGSLPMKPYKDEGITFRYLYRSATTGKMLLELTFTPEDYGK